MLKKFKEFLGEAATSDKDHADKIRKRADSTLERHKLVFKKGRIVDREAMSLHKKDHKDLHKLADHVEKGDYKKAYEHMRNLDTSTRDLIPSRQFHHIDKHG